MNHASEFLFRLPASSALPSQHPDDPEGSLVIVPMSCISHGLFTTSSWDTVRNLPDFKSDNDPSLCVSGYPDGYDTSGTLSQIVAWLNRTRPQHWSATILHPESPDGLLDLHRLRILCSELLLGGVVREGGKWCLCVRGTVQEGVWDDATDVLANVRLDAAEYLCIAIAESTTMLVQLYTEQVW